MGKTFAEKFEQALQDRRDREPGFGLRTLARILAGPNATHQQIEVIRRRLHKYRPPKGGGAADVKPTAPTRWEIEAAMGLERDALAADADARTDDGDVFAALLRQVVRRVVLEELRA